MLSPKQKEKPLIRLGQLIRRMAGYMAGHHMRRLQSRKRDMGFQIPHPLYILYLASKESSPAHSEYSIITSYGVQRVGTTVCTLGYARLWSADRVWSFLVFHQHHYQNNTRNAQWRLWLKLSGQNKWH